MPPIFAFAILAFIMAVLIVFGTRKPVFGARKLKRTVPSSSGKKEYEFRFYELGNENPFNKRILDIRSLTWHVLSTAKDEKIATRFLELRRSDGKELVGNSPANCQSIDCDLAYPHNGEEVKGSVFKAREMEEKWDIYAYDGIFYFARSWTGELCYKAYAKISEDQVRIVRLEYNSETDDDDIAVQNVHFLIKTYALGAVYPHQIPESISDDEMEIAFYSFSLFGNKACYATRDGILDVQIEVPEQEESPEE